MSKAITYTVERTIEHVEIRQYPATVLATVRGLPDNEAFGILFRYISGQNRPASKLAMTVPVISRGQRLAMTAPVVSDTSSFSFVLPEPLTLDTSPAPLDPRSTLELLPPRRIAALRFRGAAPARTLRTKTEELLDVLARHEIVYRGSAFLMRYNPPFTPPLLRRNEVGIEVLGW